MLRILSEKKKEAFYRSQLGKTLPVLWEHEEKDGMMYGFTENYVRVKKPFDPAFVNQIEQVTLQNTQEDGTVSVSPSFEQFLVRTI